MQSGVLEIKKRHDADGVGLALLWYQLWQTHQYVYLVQTTCCQ